MQTILAALSMNKTSLPLQKLTKTDGQVPNLRYYHELDANDCSSNSGLSKPWQEKSSKRSKCDLELRSSIHMYAKGRV